MAENDTKLAEAQAEALKTGNWGRYNQLTLQRANAEVVPERVTKIENGKALFLPDFKRLEESLEKQLADAGTDVQRRLLISDKLARLKVRWQDEGVGNLDVVIAIRDNLLKTLAELGKAGLGDNSVADDHRAQLAEAEKIIAEAQSKGLI